MQGAACACRHTSVVRALRREKEATEKLAQELEADRDAVR